MRENLTNIVPDLIEPRDVVLDQHGISWGYFCLKKPVAVDKNLIEQLKEVAHANKMNVRICLHESVHNEFHNMIIVQHKSLYYPPHKHPEKPECYHIIEGELGAVHFDVGGNIVRTSKISTGGNFIYRIALNEHHTIFPITDIAVYHESKPGPFLRKKDFVEPEWAPNINQELAKQKFMQRMHKAVQADDG